MRNFLNRPRHFTERLRQLALECPNKIALRNELGEEISYLNLFKTSSSIAEGLRHLNDERKAVAVLCKDPIQMALGIFAAWFSNRPAVPLHYSYPTEEIAHRFSVTGSKTILTDAIYPGIPVASKCLNIKSLTSNNAIDYKDEMSLHDPALILFTSGTTGKPKGVVHSLDTLSYQLEDLHSTWEMTKEDELFLSLPLNHIHGLVTGMLNGLAAGASCTLHSHFDANLAWKQLLNPKTSFFTAVPTIYSKLLTHARMIKPGKLDHLRLMISGSSSLSEPLLEAWKSELRKEGIVERYGMTETGMIASNGIKSSKPGCVGKPLPSVEIKISKEDKELSEFGQVHVKGPGLFKGYLYSEDLFKERDPNEWFNTGDQGLFTTEHDLKLVGRDRDILKVSGYKVGSGEIEAAIMNCENVEECVVIGLEDAGDVGNQVIAAVVVSPDDEIIPKLRRFLAPRLAHYKIPRKWLVTKEALPRNLIGKTDYVRVRALFK